MRRLNLIDDPDVFPGHKGPVEIGKHLTGPRRHDRVGGAVEDPDPGILQFIYWCDRSCRRRVFCKVDHRVRSKIHACHATSESGFDVTRGAVIRTAGNHGDATDLVRIRDLRLHGHVSARRYAGYRDATPECRVVLHCRY